MKKIKNIIYILLIIMTMISIVPKEMQNDTFFTIAGGRLILEEGLTSKEQLVWHEGLEFTNSRWLFDILITKIYNSFDFEGIYIFVVCMAIIEGILYFYVSYKFTKNEDFSFFMTVIFITPIYIYFSARAQIISNLLLLIEFYCLEMLKQDVKKRYIFTLIIIPFIFANMHASVYPIYLVVFMPFIAEAIVDKIFKDKGRFISSTTNIRIILILFLVGVIGGFCVPSGVKPYTDMFKAMNGISDTFIMELQPTSIFENLYLAAILILTILILICSKQKVRISDCLFIFGFSILTINTRRAVQYFEVISTICFFRIVIDFLKEYEFEIVYKKAKNTVLVLGILLIITINLKYLSKRINEIYIPEVSYPVQASNFINENLDKDNMRIFNHFNFGSYLEFKEIKAFVDSRSGVFTEEFNPGCKVLKDWIDASKLSVNYNDIFDKYQITHVLLFSDEPMIEYIKYDDKWKMIYQDNGFILFERVENI